MPLPELLTVSEIRERLEAIFPEGTPNRTYVTREMAAKTVFAMLYMGAVEGHDRWLGPKHVYCMSDQQAGKTAEVERLAYGDAAWKGGFKPFGERWYADTTREPIRDETLREGLVRVGAAIQRTGLDTTSPLPRYALRKGFAALFDPSLQGDELAGAISRWQEVHLDRLVLARLELIRRGAASATGGKIDVRLPNGSIRQISPGRSSVISKAVIEVMEKRRIFDLIHERG